MNETELTNQELTQSEVEANTNALISDFKADTGVEAKNIADLIRSNIAGSKPDILWEMLEYAWRIGYENGTYDILRVIDNLIFEIGLGMDPKLEEKQRYIEYVLSYELRDGMDCYRENDMVVVYNTEGEHFHCTRIISLIENMWNLYSGMRYRNGKVELTIF